jgi:DNA polymerase-4
MFNKKPEDFQNLFLDMDSFFASVEQQVNPPLRGKPVGVAPYTGNTGCIIAASKEAKKLGIKTGFGVGEAKYKCPQIKIIEARPALYMIYHKEIKKVLESISPFCEPLSVDEFLIELSPSEQNYKKSCEIGYRIKQRISYNVGDFLTCSVGVGPNKFLSKMAAESEKPDGLTILKLQNLENFYLFLKDLTDLTGINHQLKKRLNYFGIFSPIEFYNLSQSNLIKILSHFGKMWYFRLRGYEVDNFVSKTKTIGHSHVLEPEFRDRKSAENVIRKLIFKAGSRLRSKKITASGIYVNVSFVDKTRFSKSKKVASFDDNLSFTKNVFNILNECSWNSKPILVSAGAFSLSTNYQNHQISIFPEIEKLRKMSESLDRLNDKF